MGMGLTAERRLRAEQVQAIARALGEPRRFAMFQQIAGMPAMPCSALCVHAELSPATISHHLKELQDAGLLVVERDGRVMRLSVCREVWDAYLGELKSL